MGTSEKADAISAERESPYIFDWTTSPKSPSGQKNTPGNCFLPLRPAVWIRSVEKSGDMTPLP
jgi:hypothetical protein